MSRLEELSAQLSWTEAEVAEYEGLLTEAFGLHFFTSLSKIFKY